MLRDPRRGVGAVPHAPGERRVLVPAEIAASSGTSSARRVSSGRVWCVSATTASTFGSNAFAAALASGTHSANTTPLGLRADDRGVDVVHKPRSPIRTPPTSTMDDRGNASRNAPALFSKPPGADASG